MNFLSGEKQVFWAFYGQIRHKFASEDTFQAKYAKKFFVGRSAHFFCTLWCIQICTHMAHNFEIMWHNDSKIKGRIQDMQFFI